MIRPFTIATLLMAGASGLYLYQSKHEVQLLDRTIERTVHETGALRAQSRLLATEWEMLNNTDRLRQFSDTYLTLKTITPSQFTSLADLGNRLPPPEALAPQTTAPGEDEPALVPGTPGNEGRGDAEPRSGSGQLPVPPIPAVPPAALVASVTHSTDARGPERPAPSRPVAAESQPRPVVESRLPEPRQAEPRVAHAEARVMAPPAPKPIVLAAPRPASVIATIDPPLSSAPPHPAPPRPVPTLVQSRLVQSGPALPHAALIAAVAPYGGSLLGIARGAVPPAPRPLPVNAPYNSN